MPFEDPLCLFQLATDAHSTTPVKLKMDVRFMFVVCLVVV